MRRSGSVDFVTGLFVFLGIAAIFWLILETSNYRAYKYAEGYTINARFSEIGSLKVRAPVTLAGYTVGRVVRIDFDRERYQAIVRMRINPRYDNIPVDSSASILTAGLLGEKYVGLQPGADTAFLKDGEEITFTQSAVVLENLVSKYLFDKAGGEETPR
jgi:phospholipid/cholesterol/gamma-HCH transport system substrate-binding protein